MKRTPLMSNGEQGSKHIVVVTPTKSMGVSILLTFLFAATLVVLAGCTGRPSAQDVAGRLAADHRNLLKVVEIDATYGSGYVAYSAEVEWLEDVTVVRTRVPRLDAFVSTYMPDSVQVWRRGESKLSLGGKMSIFRRGQRERITGRYFFTGESGGWKWLPGRQFG